MILKLEEANKKEDIEFIMDYTIPREIDLYVDLEGGLETDKHMPKDANLGVRQAKKLLGEEWNGFLGMDGSVQGEEALNLCSTMKSADFCAKNVELVEKKLGGEEKVDKDARRDTPRKKSSNKKASKPPRPPRSPSLDAADQKLIREISELATLKRARVERMKALKKMKAAKTASSTCNLSAMIITILFCLVIILQGAFSRSQSSSASPKAAVEMREELISAQYRSNAPASSSILGPAHGSQSLNVVEQVAGLVPPEEGISGPKRLKV